MQTKTAKAGQAGKSGEILNLNMFFLPIYFSHIPHPRTTLRALSFLSDDPGCHLSARFVFSEFFTHFNSLPEGIAMVCKLLSLNYLQRCLQVCNAFFNG